MSELVCHGETGFLADTEEELVQAVRQVERLDRRRCRTWVQGRFSTQEMVERYEDIYRSILQS
jgi:glycosyltransferase involved in cell wall biosynthesis